MGDNPVEGGFSAGVSAVGTTAVTALFAFPADIRCERSGSFGAAPDCTNINILGMRVVELNELEVLVLAGSLGIVVGLLVLLYKYLTGRTCSPE